MTYRTFFLFIVFSAAWAGASEAERFVVKADDKANHIVFRSEAPMESFEGKTHHAEGFIEFSTAGVEDSITVEILVDMASLDTGIGLRNKHMRENHLETKEFPHAVFRGGRVLKGAGAALGGSEPVSFRVAGTLDIHGVTRKVEIPVSVQRTKDGGLVVRSAFEVSLKEHEIKRPKFLMLKLNDLQQITLELHAVSAES